MKNKPSGIIVKLISIGIVVTILLIALGVVSEQRSDRERAYDHSLYEIQESAGGRFQFTGPFITIPVTSIWYEEKFIEGKTERIKKTSTSSITINPTKLDLKSNIQTEERQLGIYKSPIYTGDLSVEADYEINYYNTDDKIYDLSNAKFYFACDIESLNARPEIKVTGKNQKTKVRTIDCINIEGRQCPGTYVSLTAGNIHISTALDFRGAASFAIQPTGNDTSLLVECNWPSPGFTGYSYLPNTREITDKGFTATWNIPFAMNSNQDGRVSEIGFNIIQPVALYQKLYRATHYGILFIIVPFIVFFLFEIFAKVNLHPIQYLFSGIACVLFFLLLISLSEQIDFGLSYGISAVVVSLLVSWYIGFVTHKLKLGFSMTLIFVLLYGYLYISLMSEDYAFMIGSFFLFAVLTTVMFITRKINWSEIGHSKENTEVKTVTQ